MVAESASRPSKAQLNIPHERVRATEHASPDLLRVLQRRYGLAEIVERGAVVKDQRPRVTCSSS